MTDIATIPVYRTWTAGEVITAAELNSNVRDAGNFMLSWPVCEARQTIVQSLATGSGTAISLDTNEIDTDGGHSTVTNNSRYTAKTQGRFMFSGGVGYATSGAGSRWAYWSINGTALNGASQSLPGNVLRLAAPTMSGFFNGSTDYLELFALQNTGGALNTDVGTGALGYQSRMSVRMVGTT